MSILREFDYNLSNQVKAILACGYVGKGRLEEPESIVNHVKNYFSNRTELLLKGKKVLVTAGPTREQIDPVRLFDKLFIRKNGICYSR